MGYTVVLKLNIYFVIFHQFYTSKNPGLLYSIDIYIPDTTTNGPLQITLSTSTSFEHTQEKGIIVPADICDLQGKKYY